MPISMYTRRSEYESVRKQNQFETVERSNQSGIHRGDQMKQSILIKRILGRWVLIFQSNEESIDKAYAYLRLYDAVQAACLLQLHIDNLSELPLNQYQGVYP